MTDLLVDIGNSRIKWARAERGVLLESAQAVSHTHIAEMFKTWAQFGEPPLSVRWASVVERPSAQRLLDWINCEWQLIPHRFCTPYEGGGVRVAYPDPSQLGVDRWLAMVGARARGLLPACIVDCGSAITMDVVDASGQHHGGLILPGLGAQQSGLRQTAPALPLADFSANVPVLAINTQSAVESGHLHGTTAAIEALLAKVTAITQLSLTPVLTGGDAPQLQRLLGPAWRVCEDLVLQGLAVLDDLGRN